MLVGLASGRTPSSWRRWKGTARILLETPLAFSCIKHHRCYDCVMDTPHISRRSVAARKRWARYHSEIIDEAKRCFGRFGGNPFFAGGIALYWGEGDSKPTNPLRLSNTDPRMIALYVKFLRIVMDIPDEKIKIGLVLYPDLSDHACRTFWSDTTGLPAKSFMKTQYIEGRHPTKRLTYGICMVVVNSRAAKLKMLTWIDFFAKQYTMNP
jgi:hypothetical protein